MTKLSFQVDDQHRLTVFDDELYDPDSADNSTSYNQIHRVPSRAASPITVQRGVRFVGPDELPATCLVIFHGNTQLRQSNATMHDGHLFLNAGVSLCALELPNLTMKWSVDLLTGADNGVHFCSNHNCIIAIGDFDLTCIDLNGSTRWTLNVFEFLTPHVRIDGPCISVRDDRGIRHLVDINTGTKLVG